MTEERSTGESTTADAACPKCGKKRPPDAEACARCGLVFSLWKLESGVAPASLDDRGAELWKSVQEHWSDAVRHEEFLKYCLQTDTLAAAGRLYRERLDENPRDAIAAQMQGQILAKATLSLEINTSHAPVAVTRSRWFWVVVLTAMALGIAGGLFWRRFR
jgi:hypothetical protein